MSGETAGDQPPEGTGPEGRRLWDAITAEYELEEHELALLRQAVRVADTCADLQAMLDRDGLMLGDHIHPASVELRQQRLLLGRLIVALRVPLGEQDGGETAPRTQYRGMRGPYAPRGLHAVDGDR
ncbi:hypothetical protein [uncultured Modestobacter sp.]|uniref:hypothetical protein n=1 Tax=uncultured Modestobacter sp. TaxID=380048 RepID=UPI00260BC03C|nr:hypothetical protein [uncultured Modestobacter sp.]